MVTLNDVNSGESPAVFEQLMFTLGLLIEGSVLLEGVVVVFWVRSGLASTVADGVSPFAAA